MEDIVKIFTDGSCLGNPGPGGWAAILLWKSHKKVISGNSKISTNNQMELTAVIQSLESLKKSVNVKIITDSKYVMNGINDWLPNWKKNNWENSKNKPVANKELWERLDILKNKHKISFEWVKGHNGNLLNEKCDEIARKEAENIDI